MTLKLSRHATMKLEERGLARETIEKCIAEADRVYYDLQTRSRIAICEISIEGTHTNLVVAHTVRGEVIRVITAYPSRDVAREERRKVRKGRWVRIR